MATTDKEREPVSETETNASDARQGLRQRAGDAYASARERTTAAYGTARNRASNAYGTTRRQAADQFDANPFGMLIGGFAIGALIAGLLPRTDRENQALGEVGGRINDTAREAMRAARDAGRDQLDELGLNRDGLSERLGEFVSNAGSAMRSKRGGKGQ